MKNKVTIVMYHYVREIHRSKYPEIKGLEISLFKKQVNYLLKHYSFVTMEEVIAALDGKISLPSNAVLLSFDDGYIDHFENVFPVLLEHGIQGSFYAPVKAILEHQVLDVNKIHFILASVLDKEFLVKEIFKLLDQFRKDYSLESNHYYYQKLAKANRFDNKYVIFVKRILQVELVEELRIILTDLLFKYFVTKDEMSFAKDLYMNKDQLEIMREKGMHIGSHGYDHYWLDSLSEEKQDLEISKSLDFLSGIGVDLNNWTMCYPYGAYNSSTFSVLEKYKCRLALTTKVDVANVNEINMYKMQRLDTNDIPKNENAQPNKWFKAL